MRSVVAVLLIASFVQAVHEAPKPVKPMDAGVGRLVPDITYTDLAGKTATLSDDRTHVYRVIALTNTTCPLCRKFTPTLQKLEEWFAGKNVPFLFVNPNDDDTVPANPFKGAYVKSSKFAAALGATSTTEILIIDANRTVVYRGCVDDQYGLGYSLDAPRQTYFKDALTRLLDDKDPEVKATTAPGCALDFTAPRTTTAVTYHNRISRLMNTYCVECHRSGGVGPFSLVSYDDVKANKAMIRKVVDKGVMPPWFASNKGDHSDFVNDRSLTKADKADLLAWLTTDMPEGDVKDAAAMRTFPKEWMIGKPDLIVQLPKPIAIKATGVMNYQTVSVETTLTEDKWVKAVEIQPTAKQVVHHVLVHVMNRNAGLAARLPGGAFRVRSDVDDERSGYFAAYVPGNSFTILPPGQATKLPKGSTLRFQLHYTPNGTATTDQTRLGIVFASEPPATEAKVAGIAYARISIPPGDDNHKEVAKLTVPADVTLTSLMPHMHVRGKACRYELTTPDGKTSLLMDVPHYDFNWQLRYQFAEPKPIPKGSVLTFTAWYDNSSGNPANPDPKKTVRWGPQTTDEMMLGYIEYAVKHSAKDAALDEDDVKIPDGGVAIPERFKDSLKKYDTNADGKLDAKEIDAMPDLVKAAVLKYLKRMK